MPMTVVRNDAAAASSTVGSACCRIISSTGCLVWYDVPRFPCRACTTNCQYCTRIGFVRPSDFSSSYSWCLVSPGSFCVMSSTGSPGSARSVKKMIADTPTTTGTAIKTRRTTTCSTTRPPPRRTSKPWPRWLSRPTSRSCVDRLAGQLQVRTEDLRRPHERVGDALLVELAAQHRHRRERRRQGIRRPVEADRVGDDVELRGEPGGRVGERDATGHPPLVRLREQGEQLRDDFRMPLGELGPQLEHVQSRNERGA